MVAQGRAKAAKNARQNADDDTIDGMIDEIDVVDDGGKDTASGRMPQAEAAMVSSPMAEQLAEIFRALSDPTRVRLVSALSVGELAVWELTELLGITQAAVSHQLRFLRFLKLVKARKVGKSTLYSLCDRHVMSLFAEAHEHVIEGVEE